MQRLILSCLISLLLYAVLFGAVLDRPLAFGFLERQIDARLARGASIAGRKLVILAGSNGPYSHRCETIEPALGIACVNGGVAVGIGLDYLFARWAPLLRPGDVVYMPMEDAQYVRSRAATVAGPDAAIMFRHDRTTLATLPPRRWAGALFAFDLRAGVMSLIEHGLILLRFHDPRAETTGTSNAWGDHVGHSEALAAASRAMLETLHPMEPCARQIEGGYGAALIGDFTRRMSARGVLVIGGLPTGFADVAMPDATLAAIRAVYEANGGRFLELPNRSRYPRAAFFDTHEHLSEPWQIAHSMAVAAGLARMLDRTEDTASFARTALDGSFVQNGTIGGNRRRTRER
jgi:hypothetical protein